MTASGVPLSWVTGDGRLLLATRTVRTFAYGYSSVLISLHLSRLGFAPTTVGALLTGTLAGAALLTAVFSSAADRVGRRRMLILGGLLMVAAGATYALTTNRWLIALATLTGTIGVTSGEVGPFVALEQAILPQTCAARRRNRLFVLYNTLGALAASAGALAAGIPALLQARLGMDAVAAYQWMFGLYALAAAAGTALFARLSPAAELHAQPAGAPASGLHRSRRTVLTLSALFGVDSLAGGFVVQSLIVLWLHLRWGAGPEVLGPVFMAVGLLQAASFLVAGWMADRIGLVNTMVFTHLPSNVLLMLIPVAPSFETAVALLLARHALSQMDVPTRQSYVVAVVDPQERTAAAGITSIVRNVAQAVTPAISGYAMQSVALGLPFVLGGGLKIVYDLALYAMFRGIRPPDEAARDARRGREMDSRR